MAKPLSIDVISDVVCPWCYVGKRRLQRALNLLPEVETTVRWRPFRLDPTIPPEGISREAYLTRKFGSPDGAADMYANLAGMAEDEGVVFNFDRIERSPNTVDAHRLIKWSAAEGVGDDVVERLFVAYFSDGKDVGDTEVLLALAGEAGMSTDDIETRLAGDEDREQTVAEIENAYRIGVSGVPAFIIAERIVVMGAHPPETLVKAIGQALEEDAEDSSEPDGVSQTV